VERLLNDSDFVADFQQFHDTLAWHGALNSLAQLTLKLGVPGLPDIYQGNESWTFNLVDPDNRRPVDFRALQRELAGLPNEIAPAEAAGMLRDWRDGRIKLHVTRAALHLRKSAPDLFQHGDFIPVEVRGRLTDHVIAFARRHKHQWLVIAVARFYSRLPWPAGTTWRSTNLVLPANAPFSWRNIFTNEITDGSGLEGVFATLPFGILSGET
jgi:(1->4)-alpha-D-glucan 1-alpha-D-glucosylmutase